MSGRGVRARGLSKRFGDVVALDRVDLDIAQGTVAALTGPNGAGKTTLLRILATLLRADAGQAWVDGHEVVEASPAVRSRIGVAVANDRSLYWRLTGLQNLRFSAGLTGARKADADREALRVGEALGIAPLLGRRISTFSTGQRQRLMLARAIVGRPSVLLLDEPMRGLDAEGIERVRSVLRDAAAGGATVLMAVPAGSEVDDVDACFDLGGGHLEARARTGVLS